MIRLEPAECPHSITYWDRLSHAWRCQLCDEIPWNADQLDVEKSERSELRRDPEPVDDRRELRFPR